MKRIVLSFFALILISSLSACKQEEKPTEKNLNESALVMEKVEDESVSKEKNVKEEKDVSKIVEAIKIDNKKLLSELGDAYANYKSINDRNENLKKLMTKDCIEKNGINFDSAVRLTSTGEVTTIYQTLRDNKDEKYAIWLDCKQNGASLKILLLVKIKENKVSEMTYNTVKQEY